MTTYPITCSGPGPHTPANGVLGESSIEGVVARCTAAACAPTPPIEGITEGILRAALAQLIADKDAGKAVLAADTAAIPAGRAQLTTIRNTAQVSTNTTVVVQGLQTQVKTLAANVDALAAIVLHLLSHSTSHADYTAAIARLTVNDLTSARTRSPVT